jgi:hypothetical protein
MRLSSRNLERLQSRFAWVVLAFVLNGSLSWAQTRSRRPRTPQTTHQSLCIPGAQISCACQSGAQGVQVCNEAGTGLFPCNCPTTEMGQASPSERSAVPVQSAATEVQLPPVSRRDSAVAGVQLSLVLGWGIPSSQSFGNWLGATVGGRAAFSPSRSNRLRPSVGLEFLWHNGYSTGSVSESGLSAGVLPGIDFVWPSATFRLYATAGVFSATTSGFWRPEGSSSDTRFYYGGGAAILIPVSAIHFGADVRLTKHTEYSSRGGFHANLIIGFHLR